MIEYYNKLNLKIKKENLFKFNFYQQLFSIKLTFLKNCLSNDIYYSFYNVYTIFKYVCTKCLKQFFQMFLVICQIFL